MYGRVVRGTVYPLCERACSLGHYSAEEEERDRRAGIWREVAARFAEVGRRYK